MELTVQMIKGHRKRLGWTQAQVAELAGVHVQTVKKMEKEGISAEDVKKALYISAMVMQQPGGKLDALVLDLFVNWLNVKEV